jgi:hypothetical protein
MVSFSLRQRIFLYPIPDTRPVSFHLSQFDVDPPRHAVPTRAFPDSMGARGWSHGNVCNGGRLADFVAISRFDFLVFGFPCIRLNRSRNLRAQCDGGCAEFASEFQSQQFPSQAALEPGLCRPGFLDLPAVFVERDLDRLWKRFAKGVGDEQGTLAVFRGAQHGLPALRMPRGAREMSRRDV